MKCKELIEYNKFNKGDIVLFKKSKIEGIIVESNRYFKEIDKTTSEFKNDGHAIIEDTIKDIRLPHNLTDNTLVVYMPEGYYGSVGHLDKHEIIYKAHSILYTVNIPKYGRIACFENELIIKE
jgi:hypothetical protein